ncbi:MAG: hypothetical protein CVV21_11010 [Candidatus Goldiibacteriota bacterium HGW-Goldbacteria-1]|nr:MAG: hypothetical protein CVV21_11010 [Candidatus Goldiibacteriota bacterium HGW-Goldbacteria-1]
MKNSANDSKRNIIYIRAILSLSIVLLALYNYEVIAEDPVVSIVFIVLIALSNFLFISIPASNYAGVRLHYLIFMMDISFIVISSHIYSQLDIQFVLAVFLTIFMAALSQSVKLSILIAIVVNAVYLYIRYISGGEGYNLFSEKTLLNIPFIFIVALHSSYLAEKANVELKEKEELEKEKNFLNGEILMKTTELGMVKEFAHDLCGSFNEAVVIFDVSGNLRLANEKAYKILGMKTHTAFNTPFSGLEIPAAVKEIIMKLTFSSETSNDLQVPLSEGNSEMALIVNCTFIRNRTQQKIGILLTAKEAVK